MERCTGYGESCCTQTESERERERDTSFKRPYRHWRTSQPALSALGPITVYKRQCSPQDLMPLLHCIMQNRRVIETTDKMTYYSFYCRYFSTMARISRRPCGIYRENGGKKSKRIGRQVLRLRIAKHAEICIQPCIFAVFDAHYAALKALSNNFYCSHMPYCRVSLCAHCSLSSAHLQYASLRDYGWRK